MSSPSAVLTSNAAPSPPPAAALPLAVRQADLSQIQYLLSLLPPSAAWPRDDDGHTALHWAAMSEHPAVLPLLLAAVNLARPVDVVSLAAAQARQTPLHWACVGARVTAVRLLLVAGAHPAAKDAKGYTAATHAVHYGRVDLLHLLLTRCATLVGERDAEGHTLVQWAAYYDHQSIVAYLLAVHGADPDATDESGMCALHRAAQADHAMVVETLLRGGARVDLEDKEGKTAAQMAPDGSRSERILRLWRGGTLTLQRPVRSRHTLPKYGLVVFYYVLGVVSYLKYQDVRGDFGWTVTMVLHICIGLSIMSHFVATYGNPGEVPRGNAEKLVSCIERSLADGTSEVAMVPSAYCFTCFAPRPARSKHSRERDRCVMVFDHECPWVNNTIGLYTHKAFLLLVTSTAIGEWIFIYMLFLVLTRRPEVTTALTGLTEHPSLCLLILLHGFISVFCVMLLVTHIRLVVRGQTTYEHLVAMREKVTSNQYDLGAWKNIVSFMTTTGPGTGRTTSSFSFQTFKEVVLGAEPSSRYEPKVNPGRVPGTPLFKSDQAEPFDPV